MFKVVSQSIPAVNILYFGQFSLLSYSPLPLPSSSVLNSFQYMLLYPLPAQILFSFPSFLEFHRVVSLLQICSKYKLAYDHVCFYAYVCLFNLSFSYEKKHVDFVFLNLAFFSPVPSVCLQTTWCHSSNSFALFKWYIWTVYPPASASWQLQL
jgi:hypothetical protein